MDMAKIKGIFFDANAGFGIVPYTILLLRGDNEYESCWIGVSSANLP
jgi:hypothetical protein